MLEKLETLYGKKSNVSGLQRLFFNYKYDERKSVIENCMTIQQYADELSALGESVKENWIMQRILGILPTRLQHFRTSWDNVISTDKTLNNMFERLQLEEDRQKESEQANNECQNEMCIRDSY